MESKLQIHDSLPSTNKYALELAGKGSPHGTCIIALEQTNGHGQHSRRWDGPKGSLALSVILHNPKTPLPTLTIEIGEKILSFLCKLTGENEFTRKPPNDILYRGKKLCGVLIEATTCGKNTVAVVGVGLDVNNKWQDSYCLREITGHELDVIEIGKRISELII